MKAFICIYFLFFVNILFTQEKFIDKNGSITFEASEQAFEEVKAKNKSATVILNIETGEMASLALTKEFRFKNSLMEEHFNENYVESDDFPKAIFRGKLLDFNFEDLSNEEQEFKIVGKLELRGKEKEIEAILLLSFKEQNIYITGNFVVKPQDFDIKIPKIVRNKIAKQVIITIDFKLRKQ